MHDIDAEQRTKAQKRIFGVYLELAHRERTLDLLVVHRISLRKASSARRSSVPTLEARTSSAAAISSYERPE